MTSLRSLLLKRRRIDPLVLSAGILLLGLMIGVGKVVFLLFALCGLYLALARHRAARRSWTLYGTMLVAWALWQIGLSLLRGEPLAGNRVLSYAAIELGMAFVPAGLCLVRRPLDALAIGARLALLALLVAAPVDYVLSDGRVGLGANEALFAFVAGVVGIAARLPARSPPRWLPNGAAWTYLSAVPILLSGTRAAFVVIALAALVDLLRLFGRGVGRPSKRVIALSLVGLAVIAYPTAQIIGQRYESAVDELRNFEATGRAAGSVDARLVMWTSAWAVIREHPLFGVGGTHKMEAAGEKAGPNGFMVTYYQHLHNFILDETISSGVIGLALMLSVFVAFLATVFRRTRERTLREVALLLVGFLVTFGSFHGVLLNEWTLIALFGTMGGLVASLGRAGTGAGAGSRG